MEKCFEGKDLNPKTCQFNVKCKEGYARDENFKCVKMTRMTRKISPKENVPKFIVKTRKVNSKKVEEMINTVIHKIQNDLSKAGLILRSIKAIKPKVTPDLKEKYKQMVKMYNEKYNREVSISPNYQNKSITPVVLNEPPPAAPKLSLPKMPSPPREQMVAYPIAPSDNKPKKHISLYTAVHGSLLQDNKREYKLINFDKLKNIERIKYVRFGENNCPNFANRMDHLLRHSHLKIYNKLTPDKKELFAKAILSSKQNYMDNNFDFKNIEKYVNLEEPNNREHFIKFVKRIKEIEKNITETIYEKGNPPPVMINKSYEGKDLNENKHHFVGIVDYDGFDVSTLFPVYHLPNKFKLERTIKKGGNYVFKLQDLLEHLMNEGYTDITLYDSSCNSDYMNDSNLINCNVLVLCQRKYTLDGEPIVNEKISFLARFILDKKYNRRLRLNIEYVSDMSGIKNTTNNGIVNHDIKFGNEPITSETFEQNAYDLIIMNTCPFMNMDYDSIYKYLKPGGILAASIYSYMENYLDAKKKIERLKKEFSMHFKKIDPAKFKMINYRLVQDAILFEKI